MNFWIPKIKTIIGDQISMFRIQGYEKDNIVQIYSITTKIKPRLQLQQFFTKKDYKCGYS